MRVGQLGERVGVPGHRLAALGVELGDAVRLDVLLAGEAELLLDGQLDRQAVAVPAGLAGDVEALHRPVAGEDVLEDAGLDVVGAGHAVGGRRALVEDPLGAALGLLQAAGEDLSLAARSRAPRARGRAGRPGRAPGGTAAVLIGFLRRTFVPAPSEGREPVARSRGTTLLGRERRAHGPLIGVALPVLLGPRRRAFFRRLRGDLPAAHAPGLPPSPGRSWLRAALLVPIHASRCAQCTGPRAGRPTGLRRPRGAPGSAACGPRRGATGRGRR